MTVISAVISNHCIAIASDSLLTAYNSNKKTYSIIESRKQKIVRVEKFLGAFSYWGLAAKTEHSKQTTYSWLTEISNKSTKFNNLEEYAFFVKNELQKEIKSYNISKKKDTGIGIHLIGYETHGDDKIPELYLISNYVDENYQKVGDLTVSRQLFNTIPDSYKFNKITDTKLNKQLLVKKFLAEGKIFVFNNGDPKMFTPLFESYKHMMNLSKQRNALKEITDIEIYRSIARRPIEMIIKAQKDFYKPGKSIVGGRLHDLVIEKRTGKFSSTSGV